MKKQIIFSAAILFCLSQTSLSAQNPGVSKIQDEQETALEAGIRELGQPKTAELEIDRTKAVCFSVADNNHFSLEEVAAMRIALSDENMGRLRMTCASR